MAIAKRGKDKYQIEILLGIDRETGKHLRHSEIFYGGKKDAEARESELKAQYKKGELTQVKKITFEEFIKIWLKEYAETNLSPKTIHRYKELLTARIIPSLGFIKLNKLIPTDILRFENDLRENGSRKDGKKEGLSETTVLHHHRLICAILESAVKWGYIASNPSKKIEGPKKIQLEIKHFDLEQIQMFINAISKEELKYQALIMLAIDTGARRGELMGLEWSDVNFKNNTISINKSSQYIASFGVVTKSPKNETSNRVITISEGVIKLLKTLRTSQLRDKVRLGTKWKNSNRVFLTYDGSPIHPDTITKRLPKFINEYNSTIKNDALIDDSIKESLYLPEITFHGLRHTNATLLISQNVNMKTVSSRLGHSNISTTMDIYAKALKSADEDAADKLNNIWTTNHQMKETKPG